MIRDGDLPPAGSLELLRNYDTFDGLNVSSEDWIGYAFESAHEWSEVFFQEGLHFINGGWFDTLTVEVRQGGVWVAVTGLTVTPAYPFSDNGVSYEAFNLTFDRISGDGIRIIGAPGGTTDFITVGELRVFGDCEEPPPLPPPPPPPLPLPQALTPISCGVDLSATGGEIIAQVTAPTGVSNPDINVIRDGVLPPAGSLELLLGYDTFDGVNAASEGWIGYAFDSAHEWSEVFFQEGLHFINGGWFDTLTVEVRQGGVWVEVTGLTITPAYPAADNGVSYEAFNLTFDPISGDGIRNHRRAGRHGGLHQRGGAASVRGLPPLTPGLCVGQAPRAATARATFPFLIGPVPSADSWIPGGAATRGPCYPPAARGAGHGATPRQCRDRDGQRARDRAGHRRGAGARGRGHRGGGHRHVAGRRDGGGGASRGAAGSGGGAGRDERRIGGRLRREGDRRVRAGRRASEQRGASSASTSGRRRSSSRTGTCATR